MKKIIIFAFAVIATMQMAKADILYWQVSTDQIKTKLGESVSSSDYSYISINAYDATTGVGNILATETAADASKLTSTSGAGDSQEVKLAVSYLASYVAHDYAALSFVVELYNNSGTVTYTSDVLSATDLAAYITETADFARSWSSMTVNSVSGLTFTAAPEPTSGLLVLIGAALLGLKRRKVA